jgi:hypothetical protein
MRERPVLRKLLGACCIAGVVTGAEWCVSRSLTGWSAKSLLADLGLLVFATPGALTLREHFHPWPKRRRSREREADEESAASE